MGALVAQHMFHVCSFMFNLCSYMEIYVRIDILIHNIILTNLIVDFLSPYAAHLICTINTICQAYLHYLHCLADTTCSIYTI